MTFGEYERLVASLAESVASRVENLPKGAIRFGRQNRWIGASGFPHQIDVSIRVPDFALLVECKYWARPRMVPVEAVLVLISRLQDIRPTLPVRVEAALISSVGFQRGALQVGRHHGIHCDVVRSAGEFGFKYRDLLLVQPRAPSVIASTHIGAVLITGPSKPDAEAGDADGMG